VRLAPCGREPKPKISLPIHLKGGGAGGSRKKMKGNFMVLVSSLYLKKSTIIAIIVL